MEALDLLANNLANAATGGFKADREFYSLFSGDAGGDGAAGSWTTTLPTIQRNWTDFSQGTLQRTGNPLDLALDGKGFFTVAGPSGTLYTRNGSFQVSSDGKLVTEEGFPVLLDDGKPLQVDPSARLEIASDGTVQQSGETVGRLGIVNFADPSVLGKQEGALFRNTASGVKPVAAGNVKVQQGHVEDSNVSPAESAVRIVAIMRQFEMLQKAITLNSDMNRKALQTVASVGS